MAKKSMQDIELTGKRVLVRVDFNVPRNKTTGEITNDVRIQAGAPTIKYLSEQGAKVIVMTHMGRPKDDTDPILRLDKVAARLAEIIGQPVKKLDKTVGPEVEEAVAAMQNGDVVMSAQVRSRMFVVMLPLASSRSSCTLSRMEKSVMSPASANAWNMFIRSSLTA